METRFATSLPVLATLMAAAPRTLARPRLCADGTVEHLFYAPMCESMCDRCFSMTGATTFSGVGQPACACVCLRACLHATAATARKGAAGRDVLCASWQARRRFGPSLRRACTAVCTLLRGTPVGDTPAQRQARRNRKLLRDVRSTRKKTANELAINLVPNPTAWPGGTLAPSHVSQGVLCRD